MRQIVRGIAILSVMALVGACSGGSPTAAPTSAATAPEATPAPEFCEFPTDATADVQATVGGNEWGAVAAKVDDVITWTNSDGVPHKVALDDGSCTMPANIAPNGGTASIVFNAAGSYPFHCTIHASMTGTIVIT